MRKSSQESIFARSYFGIRLRSGFNTLKPSLVLAVPTRVCVCLAQRKKNVELTKEVVLEVLDVRDIELLQLPNGISWLQ